MDSCMICLKVSAEQPVSGVHIDSINWEKYNIRHIIQKHLWWWHLQKSSSKKFSHVCGQCWDNLSLFHEFYLKVEEIHKQFDAKRWPVLKDYGAREVCIKADSKKNNIQELYYQHNDITYVPKIVIANDNERIELSPCLKSSHATNIFSKNYQDASNISLHDEYFEKASSLEKHGLIHEKAQNSIDNEHCTSKVIPKIEPTTDILVDHTTAGSTTNSRSFIKTCKNEKYTVSVDYHNATAIHDVASEVVHGSGNIEQLFHEDSIKSDNYCKNDDDKLKVYESARNEDTHFYILESSEETPIVKSEGNISPIVNSETVTLTEFDEYLSDISSHSEKSHINDRHRNKEIKKSSNVKSKTNPTERVFRKFHEEYLSQAEYSVSCDTCNTDFSSFNDLKTHYRLEHNSNGYATCCNKKFFNRGQFADHLRVHENPNYFKCTFCSRVLCHRVSFQNHIGRHQLLDKDSKFFNCVKCKTTFEKKALLDKHILHQHPKECFQCVECMKIFPNEKAVDRHKAEMHPKKYNTNCDLCGKLFYTPSTLKFHIDNEHKEGSTSKKNSFNLCCEKPTNKGVLECHRNIEHTEEIKQEHVCQICSNISLSLNDHKKHMIQNHVNKSKHNCHLCEKKFGRKIHLRKHLYTHTELNVCPYCSRQFRTRLNMYTHRRRMHPKEWQEERTNKISAKKLNK